MLLKTYWGILSAQTTIKPMGYTARRVNQTNADIFLN